MSGVGPGRGAARPAGTGARTPTGSPPGARPAGPCRSGPAPARPPWRPSAARATTTDVGSVGLDVAPPPGRRLLVGMARSRRPRVIALDDHLHRRWDATGRGRHLLSRYQGPRARPR